MLGLAASSPCSEGAGRPLVLHPFPCHPLTPVALTLLTVAPLLNGLTGLSPSLPRSLPCR